MNTQFSYSEKEIKSKRCFAYNSETVLERKTCGRVGAEGESWEARSKWVR